MSIRTPSPSVFRRPIDQSVLNENKALITEIDRRKVLRGTLSLGALTLLTGCDVTDREAVQAVLKRVSTWNDLAQEFLFRPNHLAPTFPESMVVKPPRFNAYYDVEDVKPVDGAKWKLELYGRIQDKRAWTARQLYELPEQEIIVRHICVEGWDYIGQWSGVNFRHFLQRIGADLSAKYISFKCADD
jgi:DMSO/TMAO reductase YedYZ molybdopterin-dependent catalytic subunit